jgi:hypothetical protein
MLRPRFLRSQVLRHFGSCSGQTNSTSGVGPFSEVLVVQSSDAGKKNDPQRMIAALLQSSVTCRRKRWWMEITLQRPGAEPWHRLKVSGFDRQAAAALGPIYSPYVE